MKGVADIAEVFSIFHDGFIVAPSGALAGDVIVVEIEYLTSRGNPEGKYFVVRFDGLESARFKPWEEDGMPPAA